MAWRVLQCLTQADGAAAGESPFKAVNCAIQSSKKAASGAMGASGDAARAAVDAAAGVAGDGALPVAGAVSTSPGSVGDTRWAVARRRRAGAGPLGLRFQVIESHEDDALLWFGARPS